MLKKLEASGKVVSKTFGKAVLYWPNQMDLATDTPAELIEKRARGKRERKRASRIRVKARRVSTRATGKTPVFVRVGAKKGPFARALRLFIALISKRRGREGKLAFQRDE